MEDLFADWKRTLNWNLNVIAQCRLDYSGWR